MRFSTLLLAATVFAGAVTAQPATLKPALPAGTLAFLTLPDIDTSVRELMDMPVAKMWHQEELQAFLAPALAMAKDWWEQRLSEAEAAHQQGQLPFPPADLLELRVHGVTLAFTGFEVTMMQDEPKADLGLMAHVDFGSSAPQWKKIVEFALAQMEEEAGDELEKSSAEVSGFAMHSYAPTDPEAPIKALSLAWVKNGLLFGTRPDEMKAALATLAGGGPILTRADRYASVAKHLDLDGAELEAWFDWEGTYDMVFRVLRLAEAHAPGFPAELNIDGLDRALTALGLRSWKACGMASKYAGGRAVHSTYVSSPAPERRGLVAGDPKFLDLGFLKWVPKNATACWASSFDFSHVWDAVVAAAKAYDEQMAEQGLQHVAAVEEQVGLSIRDDVLGCLGNQIVNWSTPLTGVPGLGGSGLNSMFLLQMKDEQKFVKSLKTLTMLSNGQVELGENERRGEKTYYLQINFNPFEGELPINPLEMFMPIFGFQDGYMVLGFSRSDVRKTMRRMAEAEEGDSLRANPEFAAALAKADVARLTGLTFSDYRASFDNLYELAYGFSYLLPEDAPLSIADLPDEPDYLSQHLFAGVTFSYADGSGFESRGFGPFGAEMMVVGVGAGVGGAMAGAAFGRRAGRRFR